jgi:hypothetical protein
MASAWRHSYTLAAAMLDNAVNNLCNAETGNAIINVYTGSPPTNCEDAATGTLLGTCIMNATPFGAAADQAPGALITANAVTPEYSAVAAGTAGYFRVYTSTANTDATKVDCIMQGSAGEAADSTDMTLDSKTIALGGTIQVTSFYVNMPET